ncbi:MAG: hypothetical protein SV422_09115, partial [Pseudomonadota bacterium]|nr:hypothetical protein [Pseudomonadota bacterium]
ANTSALRRCKAGVLQKTGQGPLTSPQPLCGAAAGEAEASGGDGTPALFLNEKKPGICRAFAYFGDDQFPVMSSGS